MTTNSAPEPRHAIRIQEATCTFRAPDGRSRTLGPVTLEVAAGEFVTLVGPPEGGGSALLRLVAGIAVPIAGRVLISGKAASPAATRTGMVFRDPLLLGWRTVLDNVVLQTEIRGGNMRQAREKAGHLLALAGFPGRVDSRPLDLSPLDAFRVSFCRAFADEPGLVLLDDPFQNIDPLNREQAARDLQRLAGQAGATVLMASSSITEAVLLSDRVAILALASGRVIRTIPVDLPRPRLWDKSSTPRLIGLSSEIRTLLEAHGTLA